ncbi:MAG: tetratricopeptide repeat protein [Bacteroidota bacterium]
MKTHIFLLAIAALLVSSCDLGDVENPNVTEGRFLDSPNAAGVWLNGTRLEMAQTLSVIVELTELTSDNYFNNRTLSSKVFDIPEIVNTDLDVERMQIAVHNLRRAAEFGLNEVLPNDDQSTQEQRAEFTFYLAVSALFSAEYFTGLPAEDLGPILSSGEHLTRAETLFTSVIDLSTNADLVNASRLALARIAYYRGDISETVRLSNIVRFETTTLNYQVQYDGESNVDNGFQFFLYDSSQDEFAPLPRLDFLDPKYFSVDGSGLDQRPISLFKIEESYLMLAEAQLAQNEIDNAKNTLSFMLVEVIANRPVVQVNDVRETRSGGTRADYPLSDTVRVRFEPGGDLVEGLILSRQDTTVSIPSVSGTSVTQTQIAAANTQESVLELIYLMRQEIFIAEGRRVIDLGIRYPVAGLEANNNGNIQGTETELMAIIPDFIPLGLAMDDFSVDTLSGIATMNINMNRLLVQNRESDFILPLW